MEEGIEKRREELKKKIKRYFSSYDKILVWGIGIIIVVVYLYYFFKIGSQPIWWDEGDYLSIAKEFASGGSRPEWWMNFTRIRPLAFPLILAFFFKLGASEIFVRFFTEFVPALICIWIIYKLGSELFNKKVGIASAVLLAVNWVFMFYSFRMLTDIPSLFFSALAFYFFWIKYEKPYLENKGEKPLFLWLAVGFGALSFLIRYISALTLIVIVFYLLFTRRTKIFKNKNMWIALIVGLLVLSPYVIYNMQTRGNVFPAWQWYHGDQSTAQFRAFAWDTLTFHLPNFFKSYNLIIFVIGSVLLLELFFYFDLILKQKERTKNNLLLCFLGVVIPLGYFIFGIKAVDARYFIATAPLMFVVSGYAINWISKKVAKIVNKKEVYWAVFFVIILLIVHQQLIVGDEFIKGRINSYKEIKEVGLWIKENSLPDARVITASITQNQYYSERDSYDYYTNDSIWNTCTISPDNINVYLSENETCQMGTEFAFNRKVREIKPEYLVISAFEPAFTPQWAYSYPQKYNLIFAQAFGNNNGNPLAIIYKIPEDFNPPVKE